MTQNNKLKQELIKMLKNDLVFSTPKIFISNNVQEKEQLKNGKEFLQKDSFQKTKENQPSKVYEKQKKTENKTQRKDKYEERKIKRSQKNTFIRHSSVIPVNIINKAKTNTVKETGHNNFHKTCSNFLFKKSQNQIQNYTFAKSHQTSLEQQAPKQNQIDKQTQKYQHLSQFINHKKKVLSHKRSESLLKKNKMFFNNFLNQKKKQLDKVYCQFSPHINHIRNVSSLANFKETQNRRYNELLFQKQNESRLLREKKRQKRTVYQKVCNKQQNKLCNLVIQPW